MWAHRPDTKMLPMIGNFLNASSKAPLRTSDSKSSASNTKSGQVQCLPRFSACVWQSTGSACGTRPAPALRVQHACVRNESLVFLYPHAPRIRGASRWFQASTSSRRGRSLPRTISHCGSGRGDTSHQSSRTSSSGPITNSTRLTSSKASPSSSVTVVPSSMPLPQADVTQNVIWKKDVKGDEGCVWSEMQVFQGPQSSRHRTSQFSPVTSPPFPASSSPSS
jgi:hypothetical protein